MTNTHGLSKVFLTVIIETIIYFFARFRYLVDTISITFAYSTIKNIYFKQNISVSKIIRILHPIYLLLLSFIHLLYFFTIFTLSFPQLTLVLPKSVRTLRGSAGGPVTPVGTVASVCASLDTSVSTLEVLVYRRNIVIQVSNCQYA